MKSASRASSSPFRATVCAVNSSTRCALLLHLASKLSFSICNSDLKLSKTFIFNTVSRSWRTSGVGNGLFCDFIAFSKVSSCAFCVATVDCRLWASCWELERRFCEGKEGREGGREGGGREEINMSGEGRENEEE